jgi:capsular exopolysaccharide synthesis family protein
MMPEFSGGRDVRSYLRMVWRWKWLVLFFVVAAPAAAFALEAGKAQTYKSSALVGINSTTVNTALVNGGGSFSTSNVTAIAQLVTTTPVAQIAARLINPPANPAQIAGEVSASGDPATNFLTISATDLSPTRSAAITNAFARAISLNQQQAALSQIRSAIAGLRAQIATTKNSVTRTSLDQQLSQLRAAESTQGSDAAILQAASYGAPVGPNTRRTVEIGLVIGLLLAFGAIAVAESSDRRLRSPDDLEGMTELPLLGSIAPSAFSGGQDTTPEDDEAFHMLRTALTYFNVDRRLESILVTSPGEKDGKTTIAVRLALATAHAGLRVVLVDADLRRAQVSARLGVQAKDGLGAVLANTKTLPEVLTDYPVPAPSNGRLLILPAGSPPPNPSALISSPEMERVLRALEAQSDLVIIDTPAALAVSDPLPLMQLVTGVVLIARMNNTTRDTIRRLHKIITNAHGTLLGVIATGVTKAPGYEHYTPKGYNTAEAKGRFGWRRKQAPAAAYTGHANGNSATADAAPVDVEPALLESSQSAGDGA